ncbi:DUF2946 domain-containing protein [Nitrogeniibacter mangrovi]|uniref:DUF2946 domain-containing protein n=1 Tax=Nitrogeniibacter mangrovi TaxID=2016596 RepID=A0A6C1B7S9_9RHOO|nr:DUF2946 family protein [Nitrogeniibacter mangrovi]QID18999.1 DUF2946 domain-containing protein [Nitrogeniibacter mangrovi]
MRARLLRFFALAWVATLMLVVAPSIAHIGAASGGTSLTDICSALGIQRLPTDTDESGRRPEPDAARAGCPWCTQQSPAALPPAMAAADAPHPHQTPRRAAPPPADPRHADDPATPPPSRAPPHRHH